MAVERAHQHHTRTRRRRGLTLVSCTCGWSQEAVSDFGAWLASRRHIDRQRQLAHQERPARGNERARRGVPVSSRP